MSTNTPYSLLPKAAILRPLKVPPASSSASVSASSQQPFALYMKLPTEILQALREGSSEVKINIASPDSISLDVGTSSYSIDTVPQPTTVNLYRTSTSAAEYSSPSAPTTVYTHAGRITHRLTVRGAEASANSALKTQADQIRREKEANKTTLIPIKGSSRIMMPHSGAIPGTNSPSSSLIAASSNNNNSGARTPLLNISSPSRASSASPTSTVLRASKPNLLEISKPLTSMSITSSPNRLIHLLAIRPLSFETLIQTTRISQLELENLLKQYAHNDSASNGSTSNGVSKNSSSNAPSPVNATPSPTAITTDIYSLSDAIYKDLRIWDWKPYSRVQREQVVKNATLAYDRMDLPKEHLYRQRLINPKIRQAERAAAAAARDAQHRAEDAANAAEREAAEKAKIDRVVAEMKEKRAAAAAARASSSNGRGSRDSRFAALNGSSSNTTGLGISGISTPNGASMLQKAVKSTTKKNAAVRSVSASLSMDSPNPTSALNSPNLAELNSSTNSIPPPSPLSSHAMLKKAAATAAVAAAGLSSAVQTPAVSPALLPVGSSSTSDTPPPPLLNPKRRTKSDSPVNKAYNTDSDDSLSKPFSPALTSVARKRRVTSLSTPLLNEIYNDRNDPSPSINNNEDTSNDDDDDQVRKRQAVGAGSAPTRSKPTKTSTTAASAEDSMYLMSVRFRKLYTQYTALYRQLEKQGTIPSANSKKNIISSTMNPRELKQLLQLHRELNSIKQKLWSCNPPKGTQKRRTSSGGSSSGSNGTSYTNGQATKSSAANGSSKSKANGTRSVSGGNGTLKKNRRQSAVSGSPRSPSTPTSVSASSPQSNGTPGGNSTARLGVSPASANNAGVRKASVKKANGTAASGLNEGASNGHKGGSSGSSSSSSSSGSSNGRDRDYDDRRDRDRDRLDKEHDRDRENRRENRDGRGRDHPRERPDVSNPRSDSRDPQQQQQQQQREARRDASGGSSNGVRRQPRSNLITGLGAAASSGTGARGASSSSTQQQQQQRSNSPSGPKARTTKIGARSG